MNINGLVTIVTGGARGIGRGICKIMAENAADVIVADIDKEMAETTASGLRRMGINSVAVQLDVTSRVESNRVVKTVIDDFGRIDILVNNAGVIGSRGWENRKRANQDDWDRILNVNVKGIVNFTEAVIPYMKERRNGKIVNIASIAGRQGTPKNPPYSVSKTGVISLTQGYALELAQYNINVNCICPGLLWTPMFERIINRESGGLDSSIDTPRITFDNYVKEKIPLGREQTPEDIGYLAAFLCSPYSQNITGQSVNVSGGYFMN